MENTRMMKVNVDGVEYIYPKGTLYQAIAADFQEGYAHDILLVNRNGKLCELHKALDRDCTMKMITAEEKPGMQTYVEPLLFGVPKDCEEYIEAKRLLKFLNYFLPIPADDVPKTSLMREFIGGGCYKV